MNDFLFYFKLGLRHVLDLGAYDHMLFLLVLIVAYSFKQWKQIIWLVSAFTIGHTLSLSLSAYKIISVNVSLIEFLIPLTIFFTALVNLFTGGKTNTSSKVSIFFALCFGWIHGLGFSIYLRMLLEETESKILPMIEFALGIEGAQIVVVLGILCIYFLVSSIFKVSKRDWVLVLSSIVIGITIPMLLERYVDFF